MGHATNAQKHFANKKAETHRSISAFQEKLAATYSRGSYTTTTIGKTAFDGRVRNGIGSDHSFMATKSASAQPLRPAGRKRVSSQELTAQIIKEHHVFPENYTQEYRAFSVYRVEKSHFLKDKEKAIKPHDRLVSVRLTDYSAYTPDLSTR